MSSSKILFFLPFPNPFPGAAWARIAFFGQYFSSEGHDISIAGTFSPTTLDKAGWKNWNNMKLYNITPVIMTHNLLSLIFNIVSSILSSIVLLVWLRPQLVIISVPEGESAFGLYLIARIFGKPIVTDYRDLWEDVTITKIESKIYKKIYKILKNFMTSCYKNSNLVVTVTEPLRLDLLSRGVKEVKLITNGADINIFKPYDKNIIRKRVSWDENEFILIYSGIIGQYYKIDVLLKAFKKLVTKKKNTRLNLVGDGDYVKKLIESSKEMGLENHVFYLGAKTDKKELAEILSAADVGVIPRSGELIFNSALPAKVFEYFACGLPVVATCHRDSLLGKMIVENEIGYISEPDDVDALADALEKIYSDKGFRDDAGLRGRLFVEQRFDRNKIAKEFLDSIKW